MSGRAHFGAVASRVELLEMKLTSSRAALARSVPIRRLVRLPRHQERLRCRAYRVDVDACYIS
jgi:hypothetical protein